MKHIIHISVLVLILVLFGLIIATNLSCSKTPAGKNALNRPESVVYDRSHDRYLISNVAGKNIIAMDKNGNLTLFAGDLAGPKGLTINGDNLYVADVNSIRCFNLMTAAQTWFLALPDSKFLNDTAMDDTNHLYCSDTHDNCIYRVDVTNQKYDIFRDGQLMSPNGLYYDAPNQRLVIVSQRRNSLIQALYWDKQRLDRLMNTQLSDLDGITRDLSGNYFVTSWAQKGVFKIKPDFSVEPELLKDGFKGPADIYYNSDRNKLILPVMMENRIETLETW